jgi:hypothetical protein
MSIYKKLLKFQEEVGAVAKDSLNPHFKSNYFDINNVLEEVKPILTKNGLVVTQPLKQGVVTTIVTDVESGESIESFLTFDENEKNPQKIGSIITYYRRYTLCSLLGIAGEDDDAEQAKTPTPKPKPKEKLTDERFDSALQQFKDKKITKEIILAFDLTEKQKSELNK